MFGCLGHIFWPISMKTDTEVEQTMVLIRVQGFFATIFYMCRNEKLGQK